MKTEPSAFPDWSLLGEGTEGGLVGEEGDVESSADTPRASKKRKASETSMTTVAQANSIKKKKQGGSDVLLGFEPESDLPDYIPESLTIPKRSNGVVELPIFLKERGKTIRVYCEYKLALSSKG